MNLPEQYAWLESEGAPKMLVEYIKIYGTRESVGPMDSQEILSWANELELEEYIHDSIAWCGLSQAIVAKRAGKLYVSNNKLFIDKDGKLAEFHPLWAANWLKFGTPVTVAKLGYTLVFKRPGGNHVGLYVGEDDECYHVFGGNQSDMIRITRIAKTRCIGIRQPIYHSAEPGNVRKVILSPQGIVSINES